MEVIGQLASGNDGQQRPPCHTGSTCLHFRFRALCQLAGKHTHARSHTHTGVFSHSNKAINCYYIEKYTRTHAYNYIYIHTHSCTHTAEQADVLYIIVNYLRQM